MTQPMAPATTGMTLQVYVPSADIAAARDFYAALFGRGPDFAAHDDFLEWAPVAGQEVWVQVSGGDPNPAPLTNRVRFRVLDLTEAIGFLDARGIAHSAPSQLPEVVAFLDFADPWGNRLGYYQDLVPSERQRGYPGTSVSDANAFTAFD